MTRRERKEFRLARRLSWAEGRDRKAAAAFNGASRIADGIPLGQPILVGHHSERHHRRDLERIDNGMRRGCESVDMAKHHRSVAGGIERQLETSVFTDDVDAPERLRERIAANEAKAELHGAINRAWRKGGADGLRAFIWPSTGKPASESFVETAAKTMSQCPWLKGPLSTEHIRAAIRRDKARLEQVETYRRQREAVEAALRAEE